MKFLFEFCYNYSIIINKLKVKFLRKYWKINIKKFIVNIKWKKVHNRPRNFLINPLCHVNNTEMMFHQYIFSPLPPQLHPPGSVAIQSVGELGLPRRQLLLFHLPKQHWFRWSRAWSDGRFTFSHILFNYCKCFRFAILTMHFNPFNNSFAAIKIPSIKVAR